MKLYILNKIHTDKIVINNVWIKEGKELKVQTFINGIHKEFETSYKLSQNLERVSGRYHYRE